MTESKQDKHKGTGIRRTSAGTDEVYRYNKDRWDALVKADALFTRPYLNLDAASAQTRLDPSNRLGDMAGKHVLCLASGGGQQSAAFGVLGAKVSVLDISQLQLAQDRKVAEHYGFEVRTVQGDMRDLTSFTDDEFDVVWHPYSLNFVPDCREVFAQVARVCKPSGLYYVMCANPFTWGVSERDWNGEGYTMKYPYVDGTDLTYQDQDWVFRGTKPREEIQGPREYRQTLSRLVNGLVEAGFVIIGVEEVMSDSPDIGAEPGTWDHFTAVSPPWIKLWSRYRPEFSS